MNVPGESYRIGERNGVVLSGTELILGWLGLFLGVGFIVSGIERVNRAWVAVGFFVLVAVGWLVATDR